VEKEVFFDPTTWKPASPKRVPRVTHRAEMLEDETSDRTDSESGNAEAISQTESESEEERESERIVSASVRQCVSAYGWRWSANSCYMDATMMSLYQAFKIKRSNESTSFR
jgi:hypothetical protein